MQWGIKLDLKTLKGLRAMLQLMQTGLTLDFNDTLQGIKDIISNIFRGLLTSQLVGLITRLIQQLVDPIKKWLADPSDEIWKKIFACTPIDELINTYIVQATNYLEEKLYKLIESWYKKQELKNIKNSLKREIKTSQKWMGELAKLLDTIIAVSELAANCGIAGSPNNEAVQQITANYSIGDTNKYEFPVDPNPTIFNSFIPSTPIASEDGSVSATPITTTQFDKGATGGKVGIEKTMGLSDCLKKMPIEFISGVKEWAVSS
jgi:hypothetical protein